MVNPAITAVLVAASREEEVKEKIEAPLKKAQAVSQGSAIALELGADERALLDHAMASGSVKQRADGRLYLNEIAVADRSEGHGFMAVLILLVIASIIASVVILMARSGG